MADLEQNVFALILDNADNHEYLSGLANSVGFRYILCSHLEVFQDLLLREIPATLILIRFESSLTVQLKAYLDIIAKPIYKNTPIILLASEQTAGQAHKVCERINDSVIIMPISTEDLVKKTAILMRRAVRQQIDLTVWLEMDRKIVHGKSGDVSSGGLNVVVLDPILGNRVHVRIFPPGQKTGVLFFGDIRRKEKTSAGAYELGIKLSAYLEGDLPDLEKRIGFKFDVDKNPDPSQIRTSF